ncbi:hypothetical protein BSKO_07949 [Bryopsis sp. KO-2023]|nr:hypothetical protein BSKO_07949 [Bryopsis sp. KO-2023]
MSGKTPQPKAPSPGATRPQTRSRSAMSDRSESPGHSEWKNNAEKCKTGAKPAGRDLVKANSEATRTSGGRTPRSSQKSPGSGAKTPRTPRSRTPRSGTPTSGMSDDGTGARLPLYMQPTHASINKSRKPPPRSATFHSRGVSNEDFGTRKGAGARQDARGPMSGKSWTSGNTAKPKTHPKRPNSASSEPAIVGAGIIPKGHIGGRASPLETNGTISTPPPSPTAVSSQEKLTNEEPVKRTSPVKPKPPPLVLSDSSAEEGKATPQKSPRRDPVQKSPRRAPLAKKSPPTPTGVKTPPARTPAATSPTKTPPETSPVRALPETTSSTATLAPEEPIPARAPVKTPIAKTSPTRTPSGTTPKKGPSGGAPAVKSPKPVPKTPVKEEETPVPVKGKEIPVAVKEKEATPPPPPPAAVCEVVPAEEEIISLPPKPRAQDQQNKTESELKKGEGVGTKVKRFFGCMSPSRKSVSYD